MIKITRLAYSSGPRFTTSCPEKDGALQRLSRLPPPPENETYAGRFRKMNWKMIVVPLLCVFCASVCCTSMKASIRVTSSENEKIQFPSKKSVILAHYNSLKHSPASRYSTPFISSDYSHWPKQEHVNKGASVLLTRVLCNRRARLAAHSPTDVKKTEKVWEKEKSGAGDWSGTGES